MSKNFVQTLLLETTQGAVAARSEMLEGLAKLLKSGQGSDITITCKDKTFKVHSAIIASRSDFFAAACWGAFKEAQSHCIDLPDDDPTDVENMLEYLYNLDYSIKARNEYFDNLSKCPTSMADNGQIRESSLIQLICNTSMYSMGEKYGIYGLKAIASENFAAVTNAPARLIDGRRFTNIDAKDLPIIIKRIYETTPESDMALRNHILTYVQQHLKCLIRSEGFKTVLAAVPDFFYQLLVQEVEGKVPEDIVPKRKRKIGS